MQFRDLQGGAALLSAELSGRGDTERLWFLPTGFFKHIKSKNRVFF
jgi:hypothetical protein